MAEFPAAILFGVLLLSLRLESCWSQPADAFPVKLCVVGEGPGFTCHQELNDIQCPSDDCVWWFKRPDQPGSKEIGPTFSINRNAEQWIGEYYLVDNTRNLAAGLVFVMPKGKILIIATYSNVDEVATPILLLRTVSTGVARYTVRLPVYRWGF